MEIPYKRGLFLTIMIPKSFNNLQMQPFFNSVMLTRVFNYTDLETDDLDLERDCNGWSLTDDSELIECTAFGGFKNVRMG